jgi:hypothetical protein
MKKAPTKGALLHFGSAYDGLRPVRTGIQDLS